jgi:hypothetical protein
VSNLQPLLLLAPSDAEEVSQSPALYAPSGLLDLPSALPSIDQGVSPVGEDLNPSPNLSPSGNLEWSYPPAKNNPTGGGTGIANTSDTPSSLPTFPSKDLESQPSPVESVPSAVTIVSIQPTSNAAGHAATWPGLLVYLLGGLGFLLF